LIDYGVLTVISEIIFSWKFVWMLTAGIEVLTSKEMVKPKPLFPKWEPPAEFSHVLEPERTIKDLPDYHDEPVYEYAPLLRLTEGEFEH
jgi:hypothetical protein